MKINLIYSVFLIIFSTSCRASTALDNLEKALENKTRCLAAAKAAIKKGTYLLDFSEFTSKEGEDVAQLQHAFTLFLSKITPLKLLTRKDDFWIKLNNKEAESEEEAENSREGFSKENKDHLKKVPLPTEPSDSLGRLGSNNGSAGYASAPYRLSVSNIPTVERDSNENPIAIRSNKENITLALPTNSFWEKESFRKNKQLYEKEAEERAQKCREKFDSGEFKYYVPLSWNPTLPPWGLAPRKYPPDSHKSIFRRHNHVRKVTSEVPLKWEPSTVGQDRDEAERRARKINQYFTEGKFKRVQISPFSPGLRQTSPIPPNLKKVETLQALLKVARENQSTKFSPLLKSISTSIRSSAVKSVLETQRKNNSKARKEAEERAQVAYPKKSPKFSYLSSLGGLTLGAKAWNFVEKRIEEGKAKLKEVKTNTSLSQEQKVLLLNQAIIIWEEIPFFDYQPLKTYIFPHDSLEKRYHKHPWGDYGSSKAPSPNLQQLIYNEENYETYARFYLLARSQSTEGKYSTFFQELSSNQKLDFEKRRSFPISQFLQILREMETYSHLAANCWGPTDDTYLDLKSQELKDLIREATRLKARIQKMNKVEDQKAFFDPLPLEEWIEMQKAKEAWKSGRSWILS